MKISVRVGEHRIDELVGPTFYFEYRLPKKPKQKRKTAKIDLKDTDAFKSEFKIRVIEKLDNLQEFLCQNSQDFQSENPNNQQESLSQIVEEVQNDVQKLTDEKFAYLL